MGWSRKSLEEVKFEQRGLQTEEGIGTKVLRSNEYDTSKDQWGGRPGQGRESNAEGDGRWARLSPCPPNSFDHGILPSNIYLPGIYKKDEVLEWTPENLESLMAEDSLSSRGSWPACVILGLRGLTGHDQAPQVVRGLWILPQGRWKLLNGAEKQSGLS